MAGTGTIIDVSGLEGPDVIAARAGTARRRAGASLRCHSKSLDAVGMAFRNLGDIDVQTLADAIATGTHGTGSTLPCLSAEMTGGKLLTASGEIVELRLEDVPRACVSLGLLGILLEIEMRVVPAQSLRRRVSVAPSAGKPLLHDRPIVPGPAADWLPGLFPDARLARDRRSLRCADLSGRPPRKEGSCTIHLDGPYAGWGSCQKNLA